MVFAKSTRKPLVRRRMMLVLSAWLLSGTARAHADVYYLRGGGEVAGKLVERNAAGDLTIETSDGVKIALPKRMIARVKKEDPRLIEYRDKAHIAPDTVEAHRDLARWCKLQKLRKQRDHHYRRLLQLEPNDEEARLALGYQRSGNVWLSREEIMHARGMQMHEGDYRSMQEIALRGRETRREGLEVEWFAKLKRWRGWLENGRQDRVDEAHAKISAISDPMAAPALAKLIAAERDAWTFDLLLSALGRLDHPASVQTLVDLSLEDEDELVRTKCVEYLVQLDIPRTTSPYLDALRSKDNQVVNRAAVALRMLDDATAVSALIDALVTKHKYQTAGGNQFNVSTAGGMQMGGNGPKIFTRSHENPAVLRTLSKLSGGQDFGYDERAWRNWYVNLQMEEQINARRDD